MMQRHSLALLETFYASADAHDHPGRFMPEDPRGRDSPVLNLLYICRAHSTDGNANEQFVGPNARHRDSLNSQVIRSSVNHGAHCCWHFVTHGASSYRTVG